MMGLLSYCMGFVDLWLPRAMEEEEEKDAGNHDGVRLNLRNRCRVLVCISVRY